MSNLELSPEEIEFLLSPVAIRERAAKIFQLTTAGKTNFIFHESRVEPTVDYVIGVIKKNYPDLKIPFHSRWGHFQVGKVDRVSRVNAMLFDRDPMEKARIKLDLVITSVLLDAGSGPMWKFVEYESNKTYTRSEGLGVASLNMFLSGVMSGSRSELAADSKGLKALKIKDIRDNFQVTDSNPLEGVEGRLGLLNGLGKACENKEMFKNCRPGNIIDYLAEKYGKKIPATAILRAVLDGFGSIWPGRLSTGGRNLGDVWQHSKLTGSRASDSLVPFHKLSQWMTYSLIEPIMEAGFEVTGVHELTGLAEYRNGGLFIDSGVLAFTDLSAQHKKWKPDAELIVEWRALTIHLLDVVGDKVRAKLGLTQENFPLAKVLEGGTWWAGRFIAQEKRSGGEPPLRIDSDGTVF
ncbi:MAG: DUF1688 family protein [Bdellovibrionota bacterium]